jgi:hypothetical protein
MKRPKNFRERIHHQTIRLGNNKIYQLAVQSNNDDMVWVYPIHTTRNTLRFHFNWETQLYRVQIAKHMDGHNFFHTTQWYGFNKRHFRTYDEFMQWMIEILEVSLTLFNIPS